MHIAERQTFEAEIIKRYINDYGYDNINLVELISKAVAYIFDYYHFCCQMNRISMFHTRLEEDVKMEYANQQYKGLSVETVSTVAGLTAWLSQCFIKDLLESEFDVEFGKQLDSYTLSCSEKCSSDFAKNPTVEYISQIIIKILHNAVIVYIKG